MLRLLTAIGCVLLAGTAVAQEPIKESWDYAPAMKRLSASFRGKPGVVLHVGDSITYANPYGQWARNGLGKTREQQDVLDWMHTNANNDSDGWYLARFDHPDGGRSYTAAGGLRADQLLQGGHQNLPPLRDMLVKYQPQIVVVMIGTNDASAQRKADAYLADMRRIVDAITGRGAIPVLTTIPPHIGQRDFSKAYNEGLRELGRAKQVPLIDYEAEILKRRPDDWNGTLLNMDDVHPTATAGDVTATSEPTEENLKNSGYLLRGWLTVDKLREVKTLAIDSLKPVEPPTPTASTRPGPRKPPAGEVIKVPVSRDTWLSTVGEQANQSTGGAPRLKLKSYQEFSLLDFDPKPIRGRQILGASLHVRLAGSEILRRVTLSSIAAEWVEGSAQTYSAQSGSSSFLNRFNPNVPWAYPGSDFTAVTLGNGNTWWWMADAYPPDGNGWQKIAVEPALIAARVAGVSQGFLLFDDTGSEWERTADTMKMRHMPNRYVYSRDSSETNAPYFEVIVGPRDATAPNACGDLRVEPSTAGLPAGEAHVTWSTPADSGGSGTVGFLVDVDGEPLPQYLVPMSAPAGQRALLHLRDLSVSPGQTVTVRVRPVDGAGNTGPATALRVKTSNLSPGTFPGTAPQTLRAGAKLPRLGGAEVAIVDALDKVTPTTGTFSPLQTPAHLLGNHLWTAREPLIQLHAAKNEFIDFQILFRGEVHDVGVQLSFTGISPKVWLGEYLHVPTPNGAMPDPIIRFDGSFHLPDTKQRIDRQRHGSLYCEVYVPHDAPAGLHRGTLKLSSELQTLEIPVSLTVWNFTLPDRLSFLPEMNCYSLPDNEREYYRLAHAHRTVLNRVPYSQRGIVDDGCAPGWNGQTLDFRAWDDRFGPYFDGSAFDDLPRKSVPIDAFYLPIHENWPAPIEAHYNGDYWADEAFTAAYRKTIVAAVEQFAAHIHENKWNRTIFQAFLNNKLDYKAQGWSRGSAPWLLDEPANFQDFWALRFFGEAVRAGQSDGRKPILFRADISRPQWQRDSLDAVLDYNVVNGGAFRDYRRMVLDRKERHGQIVVDYGSSNALHESNVQPAAWCLDSWTLGADGVVPWQTVGTANSWTSADPQSLFYPAGHADQDQPVASIRLKAYRRGQQDVEYLVLLNHLMKQPRWMTGQQARDVFQLAAKPRSTGFAQRDDAGIVEFSRLLPQHLWSLRLQVGDVLSQRRADAQGAVPDWKPKPIHRDTQGGYVRIGDVPERSAARQAQPQPAQGAKPKP